MASQTIPLVVEISLQVVLTSDNPMIDCNQRSDQRGFDFN